MIGRVTPRRASRPSRSGRPRWPLWLAITVLVLVGLFVAADRVAVAVAQSAAAKTLKSSEHLDTTPTVRVAGFPFLTQIVHRKLSHVTVTDDHVTVGSHGRT